VNEYYEHYKLVRNKGTVPFKPAIVRHPQQIEIYNDTYGSDYWKDIKHNFLTKKLKPDPIPEKRERFNTNLNKYDNNLSITKIPTKSRFSLNKQRVARSELQLQSDENRVTYNSDKTFSVKSGMLDSNAPMKVNPDYEKLPNNARIQQSSIKPQ